MEYVAGKSFLFISLKEKLDLTLFSVRRSQYFISHTPVTRHRRVQQKDHASPMVSKLLYTLSSYREFGLPVSSPTSKMNQIARPKQQEEIIRRQDTA